MSLNNFRASVSKIFQTTCREAGMITRVQLLEGLPQKFPTAKKTSKFRPDFWQLSTYIANISGTDRHTEHLRNTWSATTPSTLGEKTLVNFGPQAKQFYWLILTNPRRYFSGNYISAIWGCCALKFLFALEIDQGYPALRGSPPPKKKKLSRKFKIRLQRMSLNNFRASGSILTKLLRHVAREERSLSPSKTTIILS